MQVKINLFQSCPSDFLISAHYFQDLTLAKYNITNYSYPPKKGNKPFFSKDENQLNSTQSFPIRTPILNCTARASPLLCCRNMCEHSLAYANVKV